MIRVTIEEDLWDPEADGVGVIVAWLFDELDRVEAGDILAEVMVEKAQVDVAAPGSGILHQLLAIDAEVRPGQAIAELR